MNNNKDEMKVERNSRYQLTAVGLILGSGVGFAIGGPVGAGMGAGVGLVIGAAIDSYRRSSN